MSIDSLIDKIINYQNETDYKELLESILKVKLYFYVIDDGTFTGLDEVVTTSKDRPVSIPIIKKNSKTISVLYTSKKLAEESIQEGFKISHTTKGIDAVKFQYAAKDVDEIVLQGKNGHVYLDKATINKLIK